MKTSILFLIATVIATHPATNPNARLLTVEESVGQGTRSVYPERVRLYWNSNNQLTKTPDFKRAEYTLPQSDEDGIVYGKTVSRSEFGFSSGVIPSPDGKKLAVYRKDERAVTKYPIYDITSRTGGSYEIRYPMAGMASEKLTLCVCDTKGNILYTADEVEAINHDGNRLRISGNEMEQMIGFVAASNLLRQCAVQ